VGATHIHRQLSHSKTVPYFHTTEANSAWVTSFGMTHATTIDFHCPKDISRIQICCEHTWAGRGVGGTGGGVSRACGRVSCSNRQCISKQHCTNFAVTPQKRQRKQSIPDICHHPLLSASQSLSPDALLQIPSSLLTPCIELPLFPYPILQFHPGHSFEDNFLGDLPLSNQSIKAV